MRLKLFVTTSKRRKATHHLHYVHKVKQISFSQPTHPGKI